MWCVCVNLSCTVSRGRTMERKKRRVMKQIRNEVDVGMAVINKYNSE